MRIKCGFGFQFYSNLILIEVGLQIATVPELPAPAFASTPPTNNDDQADRESGDCPWASKSGKALAAPRLPQPATGLPIAKGERTTANRERFHSMSEILRL
ncbi:MAG TPA: hypothetical protein VK673_04820, partial [Chthoniobacterales bacterium]|nr:hypothetical protein [Chthoniobacterales bacterium]